MKKEFKIARAKKGLTNAETAAQAGIPTETYRRIETGITKRPRPETVLKICKALGIDMEKIV